jgi:hypothetical protein
LPDLCPALTAFSRRGFHIRPCRCQGIPKYWLPESGIADGAHQLDYLRLALPGADDHRG